MLSRKQIINKFEKEHWIVDPRGFRACLTLIMDERAPDPIIGHATLGFYRDETDPDKIVYCTDPYPILTFQQTAHKQAKPHIDRIPTKEELQGYIDMLRHWEPYEILPVMALAFIAPFALILRGEGKLVPHGFLKGLRDLGKTIIITMFSKGLLGLNTWDKDVLDTVWRIFFLYDSICAMIGFNEVEVRPIVHGPLKTGAEQDTLTGRGHPGPGGVKLDIALARACFAFNSNFDSISENSPLAKRFFIVRMDPTKKQLLPMVQRNSIKKEADRLQPIGWGLFKMLAPHVTSVKKLIQDIDHWEDEIVTLDTKLTTPSRAGIWAVLYQGIQHVMLLCKELGVEFDYSLEDWMSNVVVPIEKGMKEGESKPLEAYLDGRLQWRTRNSTIRTEPVYEEGKKVGEHDRTIVKDEGERWRVGNVKGSEKIEGEWHNRSLKKSILKLLPQEEQGKTMADIGREVLQYLGWEERLLPLVYKNVWYGQLQHWSVFIPLI